MLVHAVLLASLLGANPTPGGTSFPRPRLTPVTDRLKCDNGNVLSVDVTRGELRVTTPAGVVVYKAGGDVQVLDKSGAPVGGVGRLVAGQRVRVYYVVSEGAIASEIVTE
ncbi:MAG: hypothetical protein WCC48_08875 [Anaeromyxobacteraceae bacterium]